MKQGSTPVADYSYDALDRRINKKAYDTYGTLTSNINYFYDGWQEVQELSGTTPTANLLTGLGLDEIFRRTTTAADTANPSVTNDYLTDALHSTMALTDATGTVQTTYAYEPYGAASVYGTATDNPYQYTGRENDQNGLMYFRNRYLLTIGQFASEDPMGFGAGQNMYGYAGGNPVKRRDPTGNLWEEIPEGLIEIVKDLVTDQMTDVTEQAATNTDGLACDTLDCNPLPPQLPIFPPEPQMCPLPLPGQIDDDGPPLTPIMPAFENMSPAPPPSRPLVDWDLISS